MPGSTASVVPVRRQGQPGTRRFMADVCSRLGGALVHAVKGFDDEGSVLLEQAVQIAKEAGDRPTAVGAMRERAYGDALAGRRPQAQRQIDLALDLADDDTALLPGLHAVAGMNLSDWGRADDGLAQMEVALDLARSVGDRRWEAWALGVGGWAALADGRATQAETWLRDCLDVVADLQWRSFEP